MNDREFTQGVLNTEAPVTEEMIKRISNPKIIRLLHGIIGMATEAGELLDAIKKHIYYGIELDEINCIEELGDSQFYTALSCDAINTSLEDIKTINHNKLKNRYKDKFTKEEATNRDLDNERKVLENGAN